MKVKAKTYQEALQELQELVLKIEDPTSNLDTISHDVKKAMELVKYCQIQLRSYEEDIEKLTE
ncbi:MAG: exodeoxyribonuclease VII small subunit [Bacteroidetes bacterium GWF2_40_14]|nr:MAG: exodeoxyribonuclease VII small subunit [Bacteroidetes bacterium GWF2_40_14]